MRKFIILAALGLLWGGMGASAQSLAPPEKTGEVVYIPFPVTMTIDGKTDDWAGIPVQTVDRGPHKPADPAQKGSFQFSLAADNQYLYVLMTAKAKTLITGKHGADFWNEDSLEFYFHFGPHLATKKYDALTTQIRIVPKDIGNTDPTKLTLSGENLGAFPTTAKVFATPDGWGFEAAVKLPAGVKPSHGLTIGFQAQLNGATVKDRDIKLIWSLADKGDTSYQDPSVFGRAVFFEKGHTDVPLPAVEAALPVEAPVLKPAFSWNQVGYFPFGEKTAVLADPNPNPLPWSLLDAASGDEVASGMTSKGTADAVSGDVVHVADFSAFLRAGTYRLKIGTQTSMPFRIAEDVVKPLARDALEYFYRDRSGTPIEAAYAGKTWARPAGHLSDEKITPWQGEQWIVNGLGGWYDAGDFGKYVVNGGISVWMLQNAYERHPSRYTDGSASIPEQHNGFPDLLDEARWEMNFLLNMQIPEGKKDAGLVFHKLHDRKWSGVPSALPTNMDNNNDHQGDDHGRFVYEPSTAATLNLAAVAAQASRLWKSFDPAFAERCLTAAQTAWKAAKAHPDLIAGNVPGEGGGNYDDTNVSDDFFWAAAELYKTTHDEAYLSELKASPYWTQFSGLTANAAGSFSWADTSSLGTMSLVTGDSGLPAADVQRLKDQIVQTAQKYQKVINSQGYRQPIDAAGFVWGSNSVVLGNAMILAYAYDQTHDAGYLTAVQHSLDYILGMNALKKSFVTGYGVDPVQHPHHRVWGNDPDAGYPPPPPGVLCGGPNANLQDPVMTANDMGKVAIAKRYLDEIGSYSTNEVAINWNAPLFWVADWLDQTSN